MKVHRGPLRRASNACIAAPAKKCVRRCSRSAITSRWSQASLDRSGEPWRARYAITPGPRTHFTHIGITRSGPGAELPELLAAQAALPIAAGDPLDHREYSTARRGLVQVLYNAGYLDARYVRAELNVDPTLASAEVLWQLDSGPRYYFGPLHIEQSALRDALVQRYHDIKPGEPFVADRLIDLQIALNNSNYFADVRIDVRRDEVVEGRIPVRVTAASVPRRRYTAGFGFGTDTGPRLRAGIENRRVNRRGHRYRSSARVSDIERGFLAEYDIPIKNISRDRWRIYAQAEDAEVGDARVDEYALGVAREDGWRGLRRRWFLNAEHSSFRFGDAPRQDATVVYPGVSLSWDRLDDPQFVRRGLSVSASLHGGLDALASSTDFLSASVSARGIVPLGQRGRLLTALSLSAVEAAQFDRLPPSQRWFLGGDRSVRGYAFQSISPQNVAGDDVGGPYAASASLELDYQVAGNWGLATFFDLGDVSNGTPNDFSKGVGLGFRYRSPVGMVRIDVAHPLDDPDTNVRLHLSLGADL